MNQGGMGMGIRSLIDSATKYKKTYGAAVDDYHYIVYLANKTLFTLACIQFPTFESEC